MLCPCPCRNLHGWCRGRFPTLVEPMRRRVTAMASTPRQAMHTTGPRSRSFDEALEEGALRVHGVVGARNGLVGTRADFMPTS